MKRFIVNLSDTEESYHDRNKIIDIDMSDYLVFIQSAKQANLFNDIFKNIKFECGKCKTFIVNTAVLYAAIEKVIDYMDSDEFDSEIETWGTAYDSFGELRDKLIEPCLLTDEEWEVYITKGLRGKYNFVKDDNGYIFCDDNGNLLEFINDEIVFQFDYNCNCNAIIEKLYNNE